MTEAPPGVSAEDVRARLGGVTIRDRQRLARRLQRATNRPELEAVARALQRAEGRWSARTAAVPPVSYPPELPVTARRADILEAIRDHQVVVVAGETGSGKTTQIPKMCLELGRGVNGMIGHTQPRRIAARTVAERIAEELEVPLGGPVGYAVRFTDTVSELTLVKVMTDGILLAEIRSDRMLSAYDTIIVDEAHERSLNVDFLLGYLTRLLPRRPDLKVVVTSATIDTERFAAHFGAPVVEVSGRTYPVEVRYRPLDAEGEDGAGDAEEGPGDINQALCDGVRELSLEGPGDVLVFLPGERDIRDAAEALREAGPAGIEILPLYARLSAAEQHRVFRPHSARRVVLATNVAETSLTVPGIRYVVDSGLARVSRYSHRSKVQRLPIEEVSRASADQRAGRCGRVARGVCIRLYSEENYLARPDFTDPEILRTNLASVILQMAAAGLGEVEEFPFLDAPDRRSIADGRALLEELGALDRRDGRLHLTPTGRRLARVPLDPRLARMVVEAERRGCLREVTVIATALSIQDPRERPREHVQEALEMHRRFEVDDSDFMGYVRLWEHLARLQGDLSRNQFRKRCRTEFLNPLRVREWQDLVGQVRELHRSGGIHHNHDSAPPDEVHRAVLAGLLSHIGIRDRARGDYQGARNGRWQIARDSSLARRRPPWAMAAALVDTGRTWGRTVARIEPGWVEGLGSRLAKRSYSEPWWDSGRAEAFCDERVTVYGLPLVSARRTPLHKVDPAGARSIFVRRALVEGDRTAPMPALDRTRDRIAQIEELGRRARRGDLLAGEDVLLEFYDARIPAGVTSGQRFDRWWARVGRVDPDALDPPLEVLLNPAAPALDASAFPDRWVQDDLRMPLRYVYDPGDPEDGVTVVIPVAALNRIRAADFQWQVPGHRLELVSTLIRSMPRELRRSLPPVRDAAEAVLQVAGPDEGALLPTVATALSVITGLEVGPDCLDASTLPDHLLMAFEIVGDDGRALARGPDLDQLRSRLAAETRRSLARLAAGIERHGSVTWDFGDLPRQVQSGLARGYPSVVDEGATVGVEVLETPAAQAESMWHGARRLLLLSAPVRAQHVERRLTRDTRLALASSGTSLRALLDDCATALADQAIISWGGPPFDAAGFDAMAAEARRDLEERVTGLVIIAGGIVAAAEGVLETADRLDARNGSEALKSSVQDVRQQVGRLVHPGFVTSAGVSRLRQLLRYMEAASRRLDRLPGDLGRDARRQEVVERVQRRYDAMLEASVAGALRAPAVQGLSAIRWMIEELRVSLWAQALGTSEPVSEERISRALDRLTG